MTEIEYKVAQEDIKTKLGQPEYDFDRSALNESARQLYALRGKYLADKRFLKKQVNKPPVEEIRQQLIKANGFVPEDKDLKDFSEMEREILRVYLGNQSISPKTLANSFGKTHQFVTGLLNSKPVKALRAQYWHKQLNDNVMNALLDLTSGEDADPKIVLVAAEYLKVLQKENKEDTNGSERLDDPIAERALELLGNWLLDTSSESFTLTRKELTEQSTGQGLAT